MRDPCMWLERLSKEVKRRLKDFDLYFSRDKTLRSARAWLKAWKACQQLGQISHDPRRKPCDKTPKPEPYRTLRLIEEAKP